MHRKRWNFKYEFKASKPWNLNAMSDKFQNIYFKITSRGFKFKCGERLNCKGCLNLNIAAHKLCVNFAPKFRKIGCAISVCSIAARLSTKLQSRQNPIYRALAQVDIANRRSKKSPIGSVCGVSQPTAPHILLYSLARARNLDFEI